MFKKYNNSIVVLTQMNKGIKLFPQNNLSKSNEAIGEAAEKVVEDIVPISDARSTADYRREVSKVIVKLHL